MNGSSFGCVVYVKDFIIIYLNKLDTYILIAFALQHTHTFTTKRTTDEKQVLFYFI